ncbi:hypothetical protein SLS53_008556 [Cytospora paraplurivora]|uniref:Uncharacterized protein n=1 Tax=Cytospora paraplurivora TaxID=2898453 RepID=A0AAN9U0Y0_9PEZI
MWDDGAQHLQSRALAASKRENPASYDMRQLGSFTDFPKHRPYTATAPKRKLSAAQDERETETVPAFPKHRPYIATTPKRKLSAAQDEHEAEVVPAFTRHCLDAATAPKHEVWKTKMEHHEIFTVFKQCGTGTVREIHELKISKATLEHAPPGSPQAAIGKMGYGEQQLQVGQQQGMAQGSFRNTPGPQMRSGQNMGNVGGGLSPQAVQQHPQGPVRGAPCVKKRQGRYTYWTAMEQDRLIAHYLEGKGPSEIAGLMGKKPSCISTKLQSLRKQKLLPRVREPAS